MDKIVIFFMIFAYASCVFIQVVVICALNEFYKQWLEEKKYRTEHGFVKGIDTSVCKEGDILVLSKGGGFEVLNDIKFDIDYKSLMVYDDKIKIHIDQQVTCQEVFLEEDVKFGDCVYLLRINNNNYPNARKFNSPWGIAERDGKKGENIFIRIIEPKDIINFNKE